MAPTTGDNSRSMSYRNPPSTRGPANLPPNIPSQSPWTDPNNSRKSPQKTGSASGSHHIVPPADNQLAGALGSPASSRYSHGSVNSVGSASVGRMSSGSRDDGSLQRCSVAQLLRVGQSPGDSILPGTLNYSKA